MNSVNQKQIHLDRELFACFRCHVPKLITKFPAKDSSRPCQKCASKVAKKQRHFKLRIAPTKCNPLKIVWAEQMRREMTPAEVRLWDYLRKLDPLFSAQTVAFGYIADFMCARYKVVVEVDGPYHEARKEEDAKRDADFKRRGYRTLRFTNDEVLSNTQLVIGRIIGAL